jgi:hypothetical protein
LQCRGDDFDKHADLRLAHRCADFCQLPHLGHQPAELAERQRRHQPIPAAHRNRDTRQHYSTVLR